MIQITTVNITLTFKEYQFSRVKPLSNIHIAYVKPDWIGKRVLAIPVNMHITDRYIESNYDEEKQEYHLTLDSPAIFQRKVNTGSNIGRVTLPKEWLGYDVLIIDEPNLDNF